MLLLLLPCYRVFLPVVWPEEECYSKVPEAMVVGEPGSNIDEKEGSRVYTGVIIAIGSINEVQQKLEDIESDQTTAKPLLMQRRARSKEGKGRGQHRWEEPRRDVKVKTL